MKGVCMKKTELVFAVILMVFLTGLLVFQIYPILNPIILSFIIFVLGWKFRDNKIANGLVLTTFIILTYWLFFISKGVLMPFFAGLILAFLANPFLSLLERKGLNRLLGIVSIFVIILGFIALLTFILIPKMITQLDYVMEKLPNYNEFLNKSITWIEGKLQTFKINIDLKQEYLNKLPQQVSSLINYLLNLMGTIPNIINQVMNIIFIPIVFFYFAIDYRGFSKVIKDLIPKKYYKVFILNLQETENVITDYLKGQFFVSSVIGLLTGIPLAILGFDFAFLIGVITGVFSIIPYLGVFISLFIGLFLAIIGPTPIFSMISVASVFGAVQFLEGNFITPKIMGKQTGLHPLLVMIALVLGAKFFGFVGMIVAVPVAAILKIFVQKGLIMYKKSDYYNMDIEKNEDNNDLGEDKN